MTDQTEQRPTIRTPDQRLRIFVSSTLAELADERAAVADAIASLRLTPVLDDEAQAARAAEIRKALAG